MRGIKMKKTYLYSIILLGLILITSCENFLNDPAAIDRINPEDPETTVLITGNSEINIRIDSLNFLTDSTLTIAENTELYNTQDINFTIENISSDTDLVLSGSPLVEISGTDSDEFSIAQMPNSTIGAASESTFTLRFAPDSSIGQKIAILTIANDDPTEPSYVINISVEAVASTSTVGEISLTQSSLEIISGGSFSFTDTAVGAEETVVFQINNTRPDQDLTLTGSSPVSFSGTNASDFSVNSQPTGIIAGGGNTTFSVVFSPASNGARIALMSIASDDTDENPYIIYLSGTGTFTGEELADGFASSGATISSISYLAPRDAGDSIINVGGDIIILSGATLYIYEGVTLNMDVHQIFVYGDLVIAGSDAQRVKLAGTAWGGFTVGGDAAGSAELSIDGAYLTGFSDSAFYLGTDSSNAAGDVSITNSRIVITTANRAAILLRYTKTGGVYNFNNNIIECNSNYYALDAQSNINSNNVVNMRYNTIIGKLNGGGSAINSSDGDSSNTYNYEYNLIGTGDVSGFSYGYSQNSSAPTLNFNNNFVKTDFNYDGTSGGSNFSSVVDNVYESASADNFTGTWLASFVFEDYSNNDFRFKQTSTFPSLSQVANKTSMEGCLTRDHANEIGAYGNGGYPPLWNE
jgi:hypothetical protein